MTIDWSRLRSLTAREIVNALVRDGFVLHAQRGSHQSATGTPMAVASR
jgi:predicted RNA binding protein YcfA (HicA-like mRNA interferase family)